jgi:hypothetical protein
MCVVAEHSAFYIVNVFVILRVVWTIRDIDSRKHDTQHNVRMIYGME